MSQARIDVLVIAVGLFAWAGIFAAAAQGKLGISSKVTDGILALLAALIAWRLWRVYRRWNSQRV